MVVLKGCDQFLRQELADFLGSTGLYPKECLLDLGEGDLRGRADRDVVELGWRLGVRGELNDEFGARQYVQCGSQFVERDRVGGGVGHGVPGTLAVIEMTADGLHRGDAEEMVGGGVWRREVLGEAGEADMLHRKADFGAEEDDNPTGVEPRQEEGQGGEATVDGVEFGEADLPAQVDVENREPD